LQLDENAWRGVEWVCVRSVRCGGEARERDVTWGLPDFTIETEPRAVSEKLTKKALNSAPTTMCTPLGSWE
jgi:hypothetical protein